MRFLLVILLLLGLFSTLISAGNPVKMDFPLRALLKAYEDGSDLIIISKNYGLRLDGNHVMVLIFTKQESAPILNAVGFKPETSEQGVAKGWVLIEKLKELENSDDVLFVFSVIYTDLNYYNEINQQWFPDMNVNHFEDSSDYSDHNLYDPFNGPKNALFWQDINKYGETTIQEKLSPKLLILYNAKKEGAEIEEIMKTFKVESKDGKIFVEIDLLEDSETCRALEGKVHESVGGKAMAHVGLEELDTIVRCQAVKFINLVQKEKVEEQGKHKADEINEIAIFIVAMVAIFLLLVLIGYKIFKKRKVML